MELADLAAYAKEKYGIEETRPQPGFPGLTALEHPRTGKWIALLMRQWDTESGEEIERCDLRCGPLTAAERKPYLSAPLRMKGTLWVGVLFSRATEPDTVFRLFDRAMAAGEPTAYTMVLEQPPRPAVTVWQDTPLPVRGAGMTAIDVQREHKALPERLREMRHLYVYGRNTPEDRAENFCRQGAFMADYEDEAPWPKGFACFFPTYHAMTTQQLRGYFAWRTHVRKGDFRPISPSAAYVYLYELINGIGTSSPEDALRRMKDFETGYLDAGMGDPLMRDSLRRWMTELAVVRGLPPETARRYIDPRIAARDRALAVLRRPAEAPDGEVFAALCFFDGVRLAQSPVIRHAPDKGRHLFSEAWRAAAARERKAGSDWFTQCFGRRTIRFWYPFANAVYRWPEIPENVEYALDECRVYRCRNGVWQMLCYEPVLFDRKRFHSLVRQADLMLRRYMKTGGYLKENPEDAWAAPYVEEILRADRIAEAEAARPKIVLDLSGLDRIRRDAQVTRDSLLTDEERSDAGDEADDETADAAVNEAKNEAAVETMIEAADEAVMPAANQAAGSGSEAAMLPPGAVPLVDGLPLDGVQRRILRALLDGQPADGILGQHRLMPTMAADAINEALMDFVGDTVLDCDGDRLCLVEDYRDDLIRLLGGDTL